ncbi:IclR family transcriptional regulator [Dongia mobilis]|uniref:IclR family transcriptional regulator n=1 Tax=Dongia mobilis TaxID=578943 RepID=A0A4R6WF59_9PROT|nr:IclR family transcriptional regulator [Dongia mobilis]TDQ78466.1 IclR family transcriptional regulator [Dongia mobilis]
MAEIRIQVLKRADSILAVLAAAPRDGLRLTDIAAAIGLAPTTTVTLLQSLVALNYAEQIKPNGRYRLGRRLAQLGRRVEARRDIVDLARPALIRLCQQTGEMVNLTVPGSGAMVVVESLAGDIVFKETPLKGRDLPLHGSASGKCFLAFAAPAMRAAFLEALPLTRLARRTIGDLRRLEEDLARIRAQGYATEEDEYTPDTFALAVPVLDSAGIVQATLSVHGPAERFTPRRRSRLLAELRHEVQQVKKLLP